VYIHTYVYIHINTYLFTYKYIYLCKYMYIYILIFMYICMHIFKFLIHAIEDRDRSVCLWPRYHQYIYVCNRGRQMVREKLCVNVCVFLCVCVGWTDRKWARAHGAQKFASMFSFIFQATSMLLSFCQCMTKAFFDLFFFFKFKSFY